MAKIIRVTQFITENQRDISPLDPLVFILWALHLFERMVLAAIILLWPLIAISEKLPKLSFEAIIKPVQGNIIRIMVIAYLIYLPYESLEHIEKALTILVYLISNDTSDAAQVFLNLQWHAFSIMGTVILYLCYLADIFFIANVYKNLHPLASSH